MVKRERERKGQAKIRRKTVTKLSIRSRRCRADEFGIGKFYLLTLVVAVGRDALTQSELKLKKSWPKSQKRQMTLAHYMIKTGDSSVVITE